MLNALPVGQGALAIAALAVVILLILGAARAARMLPALRQAAKPEGDLMLRGSIALDARRRVYLIDAGGRQTLVLTGGVSDVMLGLLPPAC